jgi:miniconductance mechanosensitive channel
MIEQLEKGLIEQFLNLNFSDFYAEFTAVVILIIGLLILGLIVDRISRQVLLSGFAKVAAKSKTHWDDLLIKHRVVTAIAHLAPVLVIFYFLPHIFSEYESVVDYINRLSEVVLIITALIVIFRFLNTVREILEGVSMFKDKPLQSYFQLIKIVFGIIMGVLVLSILADKSIMYFFGAFGAISAVLLLIFKDTILGFIASIQLAANDMIQVGDWVQMDKYGADGDVIEINLATVKVKNWDKTITTVPTYSFISDSFKNWRGMEETGSRRIARSIYINQHSVKFCTEEMIKGYKKIHILKDYAEEKTREIEDYNKERNVDVSEVSNGRRMTNLGTFRAYLLRYLQNHPKINQELTILVRQLDPTPDGIPIQIYAFCTDIAWVNYEAVQSDIFDHTLSVIHQFDLEIFQNPSGSDFKTLVGS